MKKITLISIIFLTIYSCISLLLAMPSNMYYQIYYLCIDSMDLFDLHYVACNQFLNSEIQSISEIRELTNKINTFSEGLEKHMPHF